MAKVTISDISRDTGVSTATVSRVLNRKGPVSPDTKTKVLASAKKLGYKFINSHDLVNKKVIVVIHYEFWYSNSVLQLNGIQDTAIKNGYNVITLRTKVEPIMDDLIPPSMTRDHICGIIISHFPHFIEKLSQSIDKSIPVVQLSEYNESLSHPYISIDNFQAAYDVVNYLYSLGRRKIALFNFNQSALYSVKREEGFRAAMADLSLPINPKWVYNLSIMRDYNQALSAAQQLLSNEDRPDAVFATSDNYAIAVLRAASRLGISVPGDLSIVGFDNSDLSKMIEPALTTVDQPFYEMGCMACSTLIQQIQEGNISHPNSILLGTELIVRNST